MYIVHFFWGETVRKLFYSPLRIAYLQICSGRGTNKRVSFWSSRTAWGGYSFTVYSFFGCWMDIRSTSVAGHCTPQSKSERDRFSVEAFPPDDCFCLILYASRGKQHQASYKKKALPEFFLLSSGQCSFSVTNHIFPSIFIV